MTSWLKVENKVVIVTGGSSGIGRSIARKLLENSCIVINFDLSDDNSIASKKYSFYKTDVSNKKQVDRSVQQVWEEYGKIDALVNNAGIALPGMLVNPDGSGKYELTEEMFDRITAVNQKSVFLMSQAVARIMITQKYGVIVNMSTESAREGSVGQGFYVGTKGAINSMTCTWAKELGKYNIRVLGVAPGIMEQTKLRSLQYEEALAFTRGITVESLREGYKKSSSIPLGRSGKLTEVADLVCFYISGRASYMSGIITNIAGGKSRG
ncbi:MAG: SDR family oxidoreductase [Clostridium sp.]|jgi:sorbitol-6-phosphate 2-dehydrogenase|uniref:SDR family oxidoreductase n=1 Tax=Clostridium sp. TaxID=1506 RepID=UPI003435D31A|nr:SDR family oxidoreductase [Clostridium sp.]MCI1714630.1 SDR family oxidoreductase [Clostridium sp.]MCI1799181.1 SDR family oxidoreductase [Clostridium sp.]MCI1812813.1 SDR family oxidoreductase [Clostridium sp.]MCI1869703.1 SDR family oxidoreductase [Clostridium sp.]